ncbi:MAG: hypothetical protein HRU70_00250 [Phycisphaeraceae bacterium]|nr:MAG: hypothetical protein HRU70_00250 [Phycisphaeraceae bacterium]
MIARTTRRRRIAGSARREAVGTRGCRSRRGVAAVVSMMFLIMFGSLAAAMAIATKGNIKTASTHVHVMRAASAAETGLEIAAARLQEAASRFIVSNSTVNATFGRDAWTGSLGGLGTINILPPPSGFSEAQFPFGLAQAVANHHAADQNIVTAAGVSVPVIGNAMAGVDLGVYASSGWVYTPAVAIDTGGGEPLCFSVTYAPLANGTDVRAIVTGYDYAYQRNGTPLSRTVMQDFRIAKRLDHAIIAQSRVMLGKNVSVNGDLGLRFTGVNHTNGSPLVAKSDFLGLDPVLDAKLNAFFANLRQYDVDQDNRLRVNHPIESQGIPSGATDYNGDGQPDGAFADVTLDGYVDDYDIFLKHFDRNGDGRVVLHESLTLGTPAHGLTAEFVRSDGSPVDNDLALLIDGSNPDRNRNGVYGFKDENNNGRWDPDEEFNDYDPAVALAGGNPNRDQVLGYRDGFLDRKDSYAKVRGRLSFKATRNAWAAGQGANYWDKVRGSIRPNSGSPAAFNTADSALPNLTAAGFNAARTNLLNAADGLSFNQQVATQLGVGVAQLATYVETKPAGTTEPRFFRLDPDLNLDGRPDNWQTAHFEKMPFNAPTFSDWYYRPVYENMVFKDVRIPVGLNALFRNCTFVGVTYVQSETVNGHVLYSEYGKMQLDAVDGRPKAVPQRMVYGDDAGETDYPASLPASARPPNQMILMANLQPMDKADLTAAQAAVVQGFNLLPDPLIVGGRRVTDTKALSNNLRFHDCLFVGSIASDAPGVYTHARNKIQFTGATRFASRHPDRPHDSSLNPQAADEAIIAKSSMLLPNYSVDIGSYNSPPSQSVRLKGVIVAGVLDARGNTSIDGALLLTFAPVAGQQPMVDALGYAVGNPADYNTTIGYFGPEDGDNEAVDPNTLPIINGQRIVGWDTNGDGLFDVPSSQPQPPGSTPVPFHGYGAIDLKFDPSMGMPDGVMLPLRYDPLRHTYREGKP